MKTEHVSIGAYHVTLSLDDDGHLSLYVRSTDGSSIVDVSDDNAQAGEAAFRLSTRAIEAKAREHAESGEETQQPPLYQREFPNFGVLDVQIPGGFVDVSWHNNACPSWRVEKGNGHYLQLFVDYARPEDRDTPTLPRFSLHLHDAHMDYITPVIQSNDYADILALLENYASAMPKVVIDHVSTLSREQMNAWYESNVGYRPDDDAELTLDEIGLQTAEMLYYHAGGEERHWRQADTAEIWKLARDVKSGYVIYSANESAAADGSGFWSDRDGWVPLNQATRYSETDRNTLNLPLATGQDAQWVIFNVAKAHYG
ncbi:hypothetical protein [Noviherbaspirillum galbum]|uniref:Uncharacterized protein n=1 Tax=Noviherbaspirillum galbum TaxID=2709383 RepID=A0A6B3SGW3_9BURK|nr:hypothetical protein [Noviherbaspirillum galbum]NEX60104.1 hypothetical protein [Noviherbaspirillum galbum]